MGEKGMKATIMYRALGSILGLAMAQASGAAIAAEQTPDTTIAARR
jgi:hypothetical protein